MRGARLLLLAASLLPALVGAQEAPSLPLMVGSGPNNSFSVPIQTLLFFTALSFLPAVLLMLLVFAVSCVVVMVPLLLSRLLPLTVSLLRLSVAWLVKPLLLVKSMPPLAVI